MNPYYEDEAVTLWHSDCQEVLRSLEIEAQVLLTDPPYFKVKGEAWDNQWKKTDHFLDWLGAIVDDAMPLLAPAATAWVFAGPALVSRVEREVIAPRLRVLNSVRWVKEAGWHQKAEIATLRRYLTPWEGIVLAEQFADAYDDQAFALHRQVFAPLGRYIQDERERAGLTRKRIAQALEGYKNLDSATANVSNWELGKSLISPTDYASLRETLNRSGGSYMQRDHEDLRLECEDLRREFQRLRRNFEDLRRPFALSRSGGPVADVWHFDPVKPYTGKHPCEKPLPMLRHMIETTSRPGDLILDPFAGSGSTADAARATGRRALLIEQDERYCEQIAKRMEQLDLFGDAA